VVKGEFQVGAWDWRDFDGLRTGQGQQGADG
jgi:hypothetical protein